MAIFNNTQAQLSTHREYWIRRTQPYEMTIHYSPSHDNPADYMSCHPQNREEKLAEEYFNFIISTSTPKAMRADEVATETTKDPTLTYKQM